MNAIGYARWSSLEQSKGSTLERQIQEIERFSASNGWKLVGQVTDEGTSAYTGANIQTGNLAQLVHSIEQGEISRDIIIVVEQLDRLSRLPPSQVVSWIQRVTALGVTIATANDGQLINSRMIDANPMQFMSIVFNSFRAFQESKHKSERLASSWRMKRERLEAGDRTPLTSVCPAWLKLDRAAGHYVQIPDRVAVVREIFSRTVAGDGKRAIANDLNGRGVETWGRGASKATGWHASYIQKILENPAVLGEFRPHTKARGELRRRQVGDPIQGYFPAVITEKEWQQVRARKAVGKGNDGQRGEVSNILSGLCRCDLCASKMHFQLKTPEGHRNRGGKAILQRRASYLSCSNRQRKMGCTNAKHYRYEPLEEGVLNALLESSLRDSHFTNLHEAAALAETEYAALREVDLQRAREARLLDLFTETGDPDVKERWLNAKAKLGALENRAAAARAQLQRARGAVSPAEHLTRVATVRHQLSGPPSEERTRARRKVAQALKELIDHIEFDDLGNIFMFLTGENLVIQFDPGGNVVGDVHIVGRVNGGIQRQAKIMLRNE